jgi:SWIM zinc finger domain protein|nr:MAG TPA: hypothetical protein [Bacteriophage sp.]
MTSKNLLRRGTNDSFSLDLEDVLNEEHLPFSFLIDKNRDARYYEDFLTKYQAIAFDNKYNRLIKEGHDIQTINEATKKELLSGAEFKRKQRAKKLTTTYKGVNNDGCLEFITNSQYTPNRKYQQKIKLNDIKDINALKDFKKSEITRLLLNGDLSVYCSCEDFLYKGYKYMAWNMGYGLDKENRFPKIKNPNLEGTICKHLIAVLSVMTFNNNRITTDLFKSKAVGSMRDKGSSNLSTLKREEAFVKHKERWHGLGKGIAKSRNSRSRNRRKALQMSKGK